MPISASTSAISRRHGWQRPLHPLQIVGMIVFCFLVLAFYCFLGFFLGSRVAEIVVTTVFSFTALCAALLFLRCAAIDPSDKSRFRFRKKRRRGNSSGFQGLSYGYILSRLCVRFFRKMEHKILKTWIRRKYLGDSKASMEPLIPFALVLQDEPLSPHTKDDDISFCSICNFEVNKYSKHCRTCNRCVDGFDHHCRWLNNCVGKRNYSTFILLMISVLVMLILEGGTAIAVCVRCFFYSKGMEQELSRKHYENFPRGVLAAISIILVLVTAYSTTALGQLFLFHVVLIRKGISTYDYILAMKEENKLAELESWEDSDFSSDEEDDDEKSIDSSYALEKPSFLKKFMHGGGQNHQKLSIRIDSKEEASSPAMFNKKQGLSIVNISPWKLMSLSREKTAKAREKQMLENDSMRPLPLETRSGPLIKAEKDSGGGGMLSLIPLAIVLKSPGTFSSPRRRLSCSPKVEEAACGSSPKNKYRSGFDLKLTQVSREMESYISRQVLCSVLKSDGSQASPKS